MKRDKIFQDYQLMEEQKASLRQLWKYLKLLKDKQRYVLVAIFFGIIYGISSGFGIPVILKLSSVHLFGERKIGTLLLIAFALLPVCVMLIRGVSGFLSSYYFSACGQYIVERLRVQIFEKIQRLHIGFFNNYPPAELISRSIDSSTIIQTMLVDISMDIVTQPMVLLGATGYLVYLCVEQQRLFVLLLFLLVLPAFIYPIRKIGKRLRNRSAQMQSRTSDIIDKLNHNLSAIKEVRAFCLEDSEIKRYKTACHNFSEAFLKVVKYRLIVSPMIEIISAAGVGFTMFYASIYGLKLEVFMSLATALYFGYDALKKLGDINNKIQNSMAAVDRIEAILAEPEQIQDPVNPIALPICRGEITFQNVSFNYGKGGDALQNIDITLQPGEKYAMVGSSGAGKSTFVNLILRFYDPTNGKVLIDGIDMRSLSQHDLRQHIGYVPQDPALINDTVYNNIIWGNPDATSEEVIAAAKAAHAHEFITQMPNGYDTLVGESGHSMSGGQRQRIALARVFLRKSRILIFDEATSALDSESQQAIYQAIDSLSKNRTVIMISHHFSMMSMIDEIFVFSHGKIIGQGKHEDLLKENATYKNLFDKQQVNGVDVQK